MSPREYRIFVSYSREDGHIITPLVKMLRLGGTGVFRDVDHIRPGTKWRAVLIDAVDSCELLLLFWCHHSAKSAEVRKEYTQALRSGKSLAPVLLDDTPLSEQLSEYQFIDMRGLFRHVNDTSEEAEWGDGELADYDFVDIESSNPDEERRVREVAERRLLEGIGAQLGDLELRKQAESSTSANSRADLLLGGQAPRFSAAAERGRSAPEAACGGSPVDNLNIGAIVREEVEKAFRELGHANVLIAGRTGVGKSTLINSIFQGDFATTGQGRPVTQNTREITKDGIPLSIYDTRGLELADFSSTMKSLRSFIAERHGDRDQKKHIHVAWVCIAEDLRRVEQAETELTAMLAEFMPVIGVVTKARADQGFSAEVQRLLPATKNVVRVRAIPEQLDDGHSMPPMGLVELVQLTVRLFPEGLQRAFVAAQKADLDLKRQRSRLIVATAVTSAAVIGATPISFPDAPFIVSIQIGMVAGITATYGLPFSNGFLSALVASAVGGTAATFTGRAIAGGILKLIPGVGWAARAATAGTITKVFGEAYIASLHTLFEKYSGEPPSQDEVLAEVRKLFQQWYVVRPNQAPGATGGRSGPPVGS